MPQGLGIHGASVRMATSPRIEMVPDALVLPPTKRDESAGVPSGFVFDGGIYDANGRAVPLAQHVGGGGQNKTTVGIGGKIECSREAGTWVFGGWLRNHFGHFIEESLGRLWAIPRLEEPIAGVVFLLWGGWDPAAAGKADATARRGFVREAFRLLGIRQPIRVVTAPCAFEKLLVPQQLHLHRTLEDVTGWRTQQAFLRSMIERVPTGAVAPRRIYVSRANLDVALSRFVLEEVIEVSLRQSNYHIVHPEELTLGEQAALYAGAKQMIFAEGSSVHFAAPFCGRQTRIAVLARRSPLKVKFARQLSMMGCDSVHLIGELLGSVRPVTGHDRASVAMAQNSAHPVLDFSALGTRLAALGFVNLRRWIVPSPDTIAAAIDATIAAKAARLNGMEHAFVASPSLESRSIDFVRPRRRDAASDQRQPV